MRTGTAGWRRAPWVVVGLVVAAAVPAPAQAVCGDCNGDGVVSILDALAAAQHGVGLVVLTGLDFRRCDVNASAAVDVIDALREAQEAAGLAPLLACMPEPLPPARFVQDGRFATAQLCGLCHTNRVTAVAMRDEVMNPIAPNDLWAATMMANASRDPYWLATISAEVQATPAAATLIREKCTSCHAPMAFKEAQLNGEPLPQPATMTVDDTRGQIALDGVSCTLCHQIKPDQLGTPASFSGGFVIDNAFEVYGPHMMPASQPMTSVSGYAPVFATQTTASAMCATCHTLFTDTLTAAGAPTGEMLPEQTPYLEWRNSVYNDEVPMPAPQAASCQDCHAPTTSAAGVPLATTIATSPSGMDDMGLSPRSPYGRHLFVGGNTLIPAILRDQAFWLNPAASPAAFDAVIAATQDQLATRTATITVLAPVRTLDQLDIPVRTSNLTGHKLPTSYPSRRAWICFIVRDGGGTPVFVSGSFDPEGRILGATAVPLPFETAGGVIEPHHELIDSENQVQVYEAVMADSGGVRTFLLLRAASYLKDNRILPVGWSALHPDAANTMPEGIGTDADYTVGSAAGGDTVTYRVTAPLAAGPYTVEATLLYEPISVRWANELFTHNTGEVGAFRSYYEAADRSPSQVAQDTLVVP